MKGLNVETIPLLNMFSNVMKMLDVIECYGDPLPENVADIVLKAKVKYSNHSSIKVIERVQIGNTFSHFFNLQGD